MNPLKIKMFDPAHTYAKCANVEFSSPISKSFFCSRFQLFQPLKKLMVNRKNRHKIQRIYY